METFGCEVGFYFKIADSTFGRRAACPDPEDLPFETLAYSSMTSLSFFFLSLTISSF